jgi:hypothetical protein
MTIDDRLLLESLGPCIAKAERERERERLRGQGWRERGTDAEREGERPLER